MPAAAADPSASLQGGLEREAAVGRRRRECGFAENKGAPSSPRSSSVRRVGSKAVPKSFVVATRQPTRDALGGGIGNVFRPLDVVGSPRRKYQTLTGNKYTPLAAAPATTLPRCAAPASRSTLFSAAARACAPQYQRPHTAVQWLLASGRAAHGSRRRASVTLHAGGEWKKRASPVLARRRRGPKQATQRRLRLPF
jgi:hypothetical protein